MVTLEKGSRCAVGLNNIETSYRNDGAAYTHNHYVNWSGGCDSTLLLYELLEYYGPNKVRAITYKYPWYNEEKYKLEEEKRIEFLDFLATKGLDGFKRKELIMEDSSNIPDFDAMPGGNVQCPGWLLTPIHLESGDYFYDTTIQNDDIISNNVHLTDMVVGLSTLLHRDINFRQPYIYFSKSDIIEKLFYYGIYDYTWFCEMPNEDGCCMQCAPCKTHYTALRGLEILTESDRIRKEVKKRLIPYTKIIKDRQNRERGELVIDGK